MSIYPLDSNREEESSCLPPGFRFHPTDEELVRCYLTQKVINSNSVFLAIGEVDFNKVEPWELPAKAKMGENVFYFFSLRDRKYPTGMRTNRATEAGYWKATGKDREVVIRSTGRLLGMKKTLVFYKGRAPKGEKTNWIMHEYRLEGEPKPDQQEWVVCRVFKKSESSKNMNPESSDNTSYNAQYSNYDQPDSFLPALQNLESPGLKSVKPNYTYPGPGALYKPQGDVLKPVCFPVHEKILRHPSNSLIIRKETQLGDTLENLVSGWDMSSPEPIWDVSAGP